MSKHVTVPQLQSVVSDITTKADSRFRKGSVKIAATDLTAELNETIEGKADEATTIAGYGITDAYTKTEVDNAIGAQIASAYKAAGTLAAAGLVSTLLVEANEGKVYNMTEAFETTADFVEGAGKSYPIGTDVGIVNTAASGETAVYKFNVLAGFVDLSNYATKDVATENANGLMSAGDKTKLNGFEEASASDIQTIIDGIWPAA